MDVNRGSPGYLAASPAIELPFAWLLTSSIPPLSRSLSIYLTFFESLVIGSISVSVQGWVLTRWLIYTYLSFTCGTYLFLSCKCSNPGYMYILHILSCKYSNPGYVYICYLSCPSCYLFILFFLFLLLHSKCLMSVNICNESNGNYLYY